ncbi:MAG TPA: hydroxymethylbilane synthase [Tepidisphaeraceae bacterium]|nr:hydroxymethylbilane synthase [Tepidisphaeraceae bacterium]
MAKRQTIRLGTRGSLLARSQSGMIADDLRRLHADLNVELVLIKTSGDQFSDRPLSEAGGKGLFTKELELALLAGQIDMAVHSLKDVPVTMPLVPTTDLIIAAVPIRQDPRDVLASPKYRSLGELPSGARIGTGSTRRRCQLLHAYPGMFVQPLRGNVDTRLEKARSASLDGVILAMAGLVRCGKFDAAWMTPLPLDSMLPAAGQGALALQCRTADTGVRELLAPLDDPKTHEAVLAERGVVQSLNGDCHSPIAALATISGNDLTLHAAVGWRDGNPPVIRASAAGHQSDSARIVQAVCDQLKKQGAEQLLAGSTTH